jgi:hypothetical protein
MHYTYRDIIAIAQPTPAGNRKTTITLDHGDIAESCVSNIWDLTGPGTVDYYIDPAGITVTPSPTVSRLYR